MAEKKQKLGAEPKSKVRKAVSNNSIDSTAEVALAVLDKVPIYEDALQPLAKQLGRTLGTLGGAINALLAPLTAWSHRSEYALQQYKDSLADQLKDVPAERLITPKKVVALPLLEALPYAVDEPDIREMYAKLLASAMDSKTAHEAFPAFVEIVRQLTPDEARIVKLLYVDRVIPMVSVLKQWAMTIPDEEYFDTYELLGRAPGGTVSVTQRSTVLSDFNVISEKTVIDFPSNVRTYIDNVCRLGLATLTSDPQSFWVPPRTFDELYEHPVVKQARLPEDVPDGGRNQGKSISRSIFKITELGVQFCRICVEPHKE